MLFIALQLCVLVNLLGSFLYSVIQKTCYTTFIHNFGKYPAISKIPSLLNSARNLRGSGETHLSCIVRNVTTVLLQISRWFWEWKNFENQLTFVKVMNECRVACFLTHSVVMCSCLINGGGWLLCRMNIGFHLKSWLHDWVLI